MIRIALTFTSLFLATAVYANSITVQADSLEVQHSKRTALFTGNVHLIRNNLELFSERLTTYYRDREEGIERVVASGHVRIIKGDISGHADQADLDNDKQLLTLSGNAVMENPYGKMQGDMIEYRLDNGIMRVFSKRKSGGRVQIHVEEDEVR